MKVQLGPGSRTQFIETKDVKLIELSNPADNPADHIYLVWINGISQPARLTPEAYAPLKAQLEAEIAYRAKLSAQADEQE